MTIDEFKKIKITAMKEKDKDAVDIYNIIISKLMLVMLYSFNVIYKEVYINIIAFAILNKTRFSSS